MDQPTTIQIFGQSYSVTTGLEPEYIQMLAAYVDKRLHTIAEDSKITDKQKLAVLTALWIADELHTLRDESEGMQEIFEQETKSCLALVEKALKETDPHDGNHQPDGQ
jgi:cell division protein ZapA